MKTFWIIIAALALITFVITSRSSRDDRSISSDRLPGDTTVGLSAANPPLVSTEPSKPANDADALIADLLNSSKQPRESESPIDTPLDGTAASSTNGPGAPANHVPADLIPKPREYEPKPGASTKATIVHQPDGSMLLDDRFVVRGSGSAEDPYQISWDLLISASETYQPRLAMSELPERVQMLDGHHVKISGHLAFPLTQSQATEALIMLNMWDGCCIGVPPSPYDAVEVKLIKPVGYSARRFFSYGTLTGTLKVDPYLVNDWLLGLYVVEDGQLDFGL